MRKLNIAIIGLGNIGSYLFKYLNDNKKILTEKNNCLPIVKYISAKNKNRKRNIKYKKTQWLNNYLDATKLKDVDLIVELIGGAEGAAKKLVFAALKNKKSVVTANKALISKYGDKLSKIAEDNKVNLEFEASVCGGVPIIRSLKESLIANKISNGIYPEKLSAYLFVGTAGLLINYFTLFLMHIFYGLPYQISQITAVLVSMLFNFHLNNLITFKRKKKIGFKYIQGLTLFMAINSIGFLANINIAFYLYNNDNVWWLSSFVGIIAFTMISFLFSRFAIWK